VDATDQPQSTQFGYSEADRLFSTLTNKREKKDVEFHVENGVGPISRISLNVIGRICCIYC
jgi:hypothetical protein